MAELLLFRSDELLLRVSLKGPLRIGRAPEADLTIPDSNVSRSQCLVFPEGGGWSVTNLAEQGTRLDTGLLRTGQRLNDGATLHLGHFSAVFNAIEKTLPSSDEKTSRMDQRSGTDRHPILPRAPGALLRVQGEEERLPLQAEEGFRLVIGSKPSKSLPRLVVNDSFVSADHAQISFRGGRWRLKDLDSTNGTFIENLQIGEAILRERASIRLGETTLLFELPAQSGSESDMALPGLVTRDPSMRPVVALVRQLACSPLSVTIHGESGTGKEVIARALHELSDRRQGPFVALNCGALPRETLESELFGHEKGAFTGADRARTGAFEEADEGTLFLDEIGDLPLDAQVKLLRTLERGEIRRLGGSRTLHVDVRIVSASHKDLMSMVAEGTFREDLYYRLCVGQVELPPLRRRVQDIMPLVEHFTRSFTANERVVFSPEARRMLESHDWAGNARELRNVVQVALLQRKGPTVTEKDILLRARVKKQAQDVIRVSGLTLAEIEREAFRLALLRHGGDKKAAMTELDVARSTFFRKVDEFGLGAKNEVSGA